MRRLESEHKIATTVIVANVNTDGPFMLCTSAEPFGQGLAEIASGTSSRLVVPVSIQSPPWPAYC